ncbi:hypothetical protein GYB61_00385 [bacterium]|nr:hypothetical protein [bacterium]
MNEIAAADTGEYVFWLLLVVIGAAGSLIGSLWQYKRGRIFADTPTSRIRSASQGYVELQGHAALMDGPPIVSPLTGTRCVWWQYEVEERRTTVVNGKRRTRWVTIRRGRSDSLFLLHDDTGECIVDPEAAKVVTHNRQRWRGHSPMPRMDQQGGFFSSMGRYRYTERRLHTDDPLYAIGQFRTDGTHHDFDENAARRDLLADWKRDENALLERFDTNNDGEIDLTEWEAVRAAALKTVRAQLTDRAANPDIHVLCRPADRRPYVLSTKPEADLTRAALWSAGLWFSVFLLSLAALAVLLRGRGLI